MKSLRNRLALDSFRYTTAIVISRIPPFILLPVYATRLSPGELGRYLTAMILVDLIQAVSGMGMVQALFRFFPQAKNLKERRAILGTSLGTGLMGSLGICLILFGIFHWPLAREALEATRELSLSSFVFVLLAGALINLSGIFIAYIWAEKRTDIFLLGLILGAFLESALSIGLVYRHAVSLERILIIECLKDALLVLAFAWFARHDLAFKLSAPTFMVLFKYGVWLVPMSLFSWMLLSIDRFWLGQMSGLAEVGVYGFFYKFASPAAILFQSYIISLDSHLFKSEKEPGKILVENSLARYLKGAGIILTLAGLLFPTVIFIAAHFYQILPATYLNGLKIYPLLLANTYIYYWAMHHAAMLDFQLRSRRQMIFMAVTALGNFIFCPVFIRLGHAVGLDAMSSVALANCMAATGLLILQSYGSTLGTGFAKWKSALPALLVLGSLFLIWTRLI